MNRTRQAYANRIVAHYQRLGLGFEDCLAFFRLAGKTFDKNSGALYAAPATTCGPAPTTLSSLEEDGE